MLTGITNINNRVIGAGISAPSGLATFRGKDGIYNQKVEGVNHP